ncbi:rho guanyl-nucleotide exchange factor 1 [Actinidia rufa]|uniref:Rho guanyl-nucleotide exchange factor 1 n=1 Tax=Actinidia rufa TaxID=165716 RepID=A0A7J0EFL1_9ERIC|nr:rho guanyl-nucleotide exchange factor 1 [Actinidia rufa]
MPGQLLSFAGQEIPLQMHQYQLEIDHIVAQHSGKACLGDNIYRLITDAQFSTDCLLDCLDLSSKYHTPDVANRIGAVVYVWKQKDQRKHRKHPKAKHSQWRGKVKGLVADGEKNHILAQQAETLLHSLRLRFPDLPSTVGYEQNSVQ